MNDTSRHFESRSIPTNFAPVMPAKAGIQVLLWKRSTASEATIILRKQDFRMGPSSRAEFVFPSFHSSQAALAWDDEAEGQIELICDDFSTHNGEEVSDKQA